MLLVTYGDSGCGVRVDFDSESDTWTGEVVDRVVGQDDFVPRPDRARSVSAWHLALRGAGSSASCSPRA